MAVADVSQSLALQQEYVRPELEDLSLSASVLWKRIEENTKIKAVSNRPSRVPTMPIRGGKGRRGSLDGGDMGIGSGPQTVPGTVSPVTLIYAASYTKLSELATDTDEKAIENFATETHQMAAENFAGYMDAWLQTAGDDALDSIVSLQTSGSNTIGFAVNCANLFQDDQDIDIWTSTSGSGTFVATVTVESVDILSNVIWLLNPILTSTVSAGYKLCMNGASGQPNSGLFGIRFFHVSANTGNWLNVQRSAYPGKYNCPSVAVNGPLTPALVRALESQRELSLGTKKADAAETVAHSNVDVRNAWEQNALLVQRLDFNAIKGDRSADMLKAKAPDQIGGRENLVNVRALPGFLDYLALKNWSRVETVPVDFYSVGGQTLFPIYGQSGGLASSLVFYLIWMGQVINVQSRLDAFASGITIPKGVFGK
jgi:hypothetical protein